MGKASIISGGEDGKYTILVEYNRDRYAATINAIDEKKESLEEAKTELEEAVTAKQAEVDSAVSDLLTIVSDLETLYSALSGYQGQMPGFISEKLALLDEILSQGGGNAGNDIVLGMVDIEDIDEHLGQRGSYESTLAELEAELAELVAKSENAEYGSPQWSNLADEIAEKQGEIEAIEKKLDTLDRLSGENVLLEATVTENKDAADDLSPEETLGTDLVALQESIFETQENIDTTTSEIADKNTEMTEAEAVAQQLSLELTALQNQIIKVEFDITALDKKRDWITDNMPEDYEVEAWCADLTEDLSGDVGTIEVPGEVGTIQIWPGYDDKDALVAELSRYELIISDIQSDVEEEMVDEEPDIDPMSEEDMPPPFKEPTKKDHAPPEPDIEEMIEEDKEDDSNTWGMEDFAKSDPIEGLSGGDTSISDPSTPASDPQNIDEQTPAIDPEPIDESVEEEPDPDGESITGTIKEQGTMAAIENISVTVYRKEGTGDNINWSYVGSTRTEADGTYTLSGLSAGSYRVKFSDSDGGYLTEYHNGKTTLDLATDIEVSAAGAVTGIDAVLGVAATISGTVTDA